MVSNPHNEGGEGVFELLTDLCTKTSATYWSQSKIPQKKLINKLRSEAYEIILKKTPKEIVCAKGEPIVDLLSYYLAIKKNVRNVAEHKRSVALINTIRTIRQTNFGESKDDVYNVLRLLVVLSDSVKEDYAPELYQNPFSFGVFNDMLPKLPVEKFSSAQPYPYFPSHVFELPYSLKYQEPCLYNQNSQTYTEYTVETFESKSTSPDYISHKPHSVEIKSFLSPMSLASLDSSQVSPYSESAIWNLPRLTAPRDLSLQENTAQVKVVLPSSSSNIDVQEVYRAKTGEDVDLWEIATQIDKDVPDDIWEIVCKMPEIKERQLIASSPREVELWHRLYEGEINDMHIISEKLFIRHIMYLLIGVETKSFPFCEETNSFYMKEDLALEAISCTRLAGYVTELLLVGTYYKRLYTFAFNQTLEDHFHNNGLVYEAAREVIRRYLQEFRLTATELYEEHCGTEDAYNCLPTLLQILHHIEPLKYEIETIVSVYKLIDLDPTSCLPRGAELMSYLFSEISLVTHPRTARVLFNSLHSICKIYFKFIERFIFEGELDDQFNEFFIRKDNQHVNTRSKRYWDKGFHIAHNHAVPEFLRPLASYILLCGKSLRLLKHCNPSDPLVLLISSDHPTLKCCTSFEELQSQQQVLDVYRTRCMFVSGEPRTFEQILLNREAERKAFTEMASLKQAETMEKIAAERARLAQLIVAEKQHALRALEAARAETRAARAARQRRRTQPQPQPPIDQPDSRRRDYEKEKIKEYYSKLNMEVEKSKIHTEWKMKRLLLDQTRIQFLSTEERNLKREKLELEHQRNEEMMAMSIQSIDTQSVSNENFLDANAEEKEIEPDGEEYPKDAEENPQKSNMETNQSKSKSSTDVFSALCNVAKSILGVTRIKDCDNKKELDAQGNVVPVDSENNHSTVKATTSSSVIGEGLNNEKDNIHYLETRQDAYKIKQKVMGDEFGLTDQENNEIKEVPSVDEENNVHGNWATLTEAQRNKMKVLGTESDFGPFKKPQLLGPKTEAQKEALIYKQKVLGVEYNLPLAFVHKDQPLNIAQEEALKNRKKILGSDDVRPIETSPKRDPSKRSGLTLNLKPFTELGAQTLAVTFNTGAVTPGDIFPGLDLETPTTADVPLEEAITSEAFTPRTDVDKTSEIGKKSDKQFLTSEGFDFSLIVDEDLAEREAGDVLPEDSPVDSPSKSLDSGDISDVQYSFLNLIDGSYNLDWFNPFGVKELKGFTTDHFTSKMDLASSAFAYTHPATIIEETEKKPYTNFFVNHSSTQEDEDYQVSCDNIATLTACLQRSVMLPLSYQLEVVNNSILTYFLVNLDLYEHLRCLKDYFFLMDGEFSRCICQNLFAKLDSTLNPQDLLNYTTLHGILDKALGSSISHVHKFTENLSFAVSETPLCFQRSSPDALSAVSLSYRVRWPLNVLVSADALSRYARVFRLLVKMRRVAWVLAKDFETLKLTAKLSRENARKLQRSPQYITLQLYRHVMASMIRALDNYIVTTCILVPWNEFEIDMKKAKTLDDLYHCHVVYIKKVLFRCLLNNRSTPVMKLLNDMFTIILKFSRLLKAGQWQERVLDGKYIHSSYAQLDELFHLFEKLAKYLHKVITKLMECGYQRHLVELITMFNLNGYYDPDKTKDQSASINTK